MSIHKSLVTKSRLRRHRNVLSRKERVGKLEQEEKWKEARDSVFALPKVRVARLKRAHVKKKEEKAAEGEAAAPTTAAETKPATAAAAEKKAQKK